MAAKPTSFVRWADVTGDIVEPNSGKKDVGWVPDERPPAQYLNWIYNLVGQWQEYLNDGDLSGNHEVDGDLNVTGALTAGSISFAEVTLDGSGEDVTLKPPTTGFGTSDVIFAEAPSKNAIVKIGSTGQLVYETDFNFKFRAANLTLETGTGSFALHGHKVIRSSNATAGLQYYFDIPGLQAGWRILGYWFEYLGSNANSNIQLALMSRDGSQAINVEDTGNIVVGAGLGVGQEVVEDYTLGTPYEIVDGDNVFFRIEALGAGTSVTREILHMYLKMDYGA